MRMPATSPSFLVSMATTAHAHATARARSDRGRTSPQTTAAAAAADHSRSAYPLAAYCPPTANPAADTAAPATVARALGHGRLPVPTAAATPAPRAPNAQALRSPTRTTTSCSWDGPDHTSTSAPAPGTRGGSSGFDDRYAGFCRPACSTLWPPETRSVWVSQMALVSYPIIGTRSAETGSAIAPASSSSVASDGSPEGTDGACRGPRARVLRAPPRRRNAAHAASEAALAARATTVYQVTSEPPTASSNSTATAAMTEPTSGARKRAAGCRPAQVTAGRTPGSASTATRTIQASATSGCGGGRAAPSARAQREDPGGPARGGHGPRPGGCQLRQPLLVVGVGRLDDDGGAAGEGRADRAEPADLLVRRGSPGRHRCRGSLGGDRLRATADLKSEDGEREGDDEQARQGPAVQ